MEEKIYSDIEIMDLIPASLSRWNSLTSLKILAEELMQV